MSLHYFHQDPHFIALLLEVKLEVCFFIIFIKILCYRLTFLSKFGKFLFFQYFHHKLKPTVLLFQVNLDASVSSLFSSKATSYSFTFRDKIRKSFFPYFHQKPKPIALLFQVNLQVSVSSLLSSKTKVYSFTFRGKFGSSCFSIFLIKSHRLSP